MRMDCKGIDNRIRMLRTRIGPLAIDASLFYAPTDRTTKELAVRMAS